MSSKKMMCLPICASVYESYDQNKLRVREGKEQQSYNTASAGTVGNIISATHSRIMVRLKTRLRHLTDLFSLI